MRERSFYQLTRAGLHDLFSAFIRLGKLMDSGGVQVDYKIENCGLVIKCERTGALLHLDEDQISTRAAVTTAQLHCIRALPHRSLIKGALPHRLLGILLRRTCALGEKNEKL